MIRVYKLSFLVVLITLACIDVFAQPVGGTLPPIRTANPTFPAMHNNFYSGPFKDKYESMPGEVHTFIIHFLKEDSVMKVNNIIDLSSRKQHVIRVKVDNKWFVSVTPSMTRSVRTVTLMGDTLVGIPADSCWLFIAVRGNINSYSPLAEMDVKYTTAIQKGDGPIVPLTKENLWEMVRETNPDLRGLINKDKLIKALKFYYEGRTYKGDNVPINQPSQSSSAYRGK